MEKNIKFILKLMGLSKMKKMNKKGFADSLIEKILWIVFFIGIIYAVYKLIQGLTGI